MQPGIVCDSGCTHRGWYDFYIASNKVTQGTVTPTHYHVIRGPFSLFPFKLTHMYFNWPRTVCVPAPCQYAHKLAFLIGQSVHSYPYDVISRIPRHPIFVTDVIPCPITQFNFKNYTLYNGSEHNLAIDNIPLSEHVALAVSLRTF